MPTVKDILNSKTKPFNTIVPGAKVIEALNLMTTLNLSYLVVLENDHYKGIFSERDYTRNVILKGRTSTTAAVQDVMSKDIPIVTLTDSVETCMNLMISHKTRYLLAYNDNQVFEGVITIHDVLRQVIAHKEKEFNNAALLLNEDESGNIF